MTFFIIIYAVTGEPIVALHTELKTLTECNTVIHYDNESRTSTFNGLKAKCVAPGQVPPGINILLERSDIF